MTPQDNHFSGNIREFASDSQPYWPTRARAREGAPNIVVMLVDDLGFSDLGPYGSEIETPHIDRLSADGWTFTNYRTAPMCSPSRASLMTGLNPHRVGFGFVAHVDPGYPGFTCEIPTNAPTLAESLRAAGYATFMVGKWHLTLESRLHDAADKSSWPLQRGFDNYFGSMDGFTSVHHPHRLVRDNSVIDRKEFPDGYFLTDELTDEALSMVHRLRQSDESKPFFLYYAHTSVHGPIQAKEVDIEKFEGKYEAGWNALREQRFARQKALGIISNLALLPDAEQADEERIPRWDSLSEDDKALFARHMEVYAAAVSEVDQSVGQILDGLESIGEANDTIFVIASDNGGSAEGGSRGTRSYFAQFGSDSPLPAEWVSDVHRDPRLIGSPRLFSQYPAGWGRVSNTPYRAFKSSTYEGGVHAPLIISWPNAPSELRPGMRHQFIFVADLAPTLLDLAEVEPLTTRHGEIAEQMDGQSRAEVMRDESADGRDEQYFECVGNRAYIEGDLKLVSTKLPLKSEGAAGGTWELYDLKVDPTETNDFSSKEPSEVSRLAEKWRSAAWQNSVFPLNDDGSLTHTRPATEMRLAMPLTLRPFGTALERFRSSKLTVLRSFHIDFRITVTSKTSGAIVAHGDQGGGYLLAFSEGRPLISYNAYGDMHRAQGRSLSPGSYSLRLTFVEVPELKWDISLLLLPSAEPSHDYDLPEEPLDQLISLKGLPMLFGMAPFTGISVGYDYGSPVDWDLFEQFGAQWFTDGVLSSVTYMPGPISTYDRTKIVEMTQPIRDLAD